MKCPNCSAELENGKNAKYCPFCGSKIESEEKMPTTVPGAAYGIANSVIKEVANQINYARDHADEIDERRKKRDREKLKQGFIMLIIAVILIGGIIAFCMYMAAKEKGLA